MFQMYLTLESLLNQYNQSWEPKSNWIQNTCKFYRYEGGIYSGALKCLIGVWYLYALVITSSYAGEIRSFFINPGTTTPIDHLDNVVQSGLGWGLILYGEEEEKVMEASTDPTISKIWEVSTDRSKPLE